VDQLQWAFRAPKMQVKVVTVDHLLLLLQHCCQAALLS
jgi:hypothetical protein